MQTGWVKPPKPIMGLDHVGTQSPCTLIYSQLLPGITNVTDRARYYSFYPWIVRCLDTRYKEASIESYIDFYRRADCLLTLISERHARTLEDEHHGEAMIGRLRLVPALTKLEEGKELKLSTYATREDGSDERYFQNRLGGLGQYYAGQLAELRILNASGGEWVTYTPEAGTPLAKALDTIPEANRFWNCVDADVITLDDLDALQAFCICKLNNQEEERSLLLDLFFARTEFFRLPSQSGNYDPSFRRDSLALLLHLAHDLSSDASVRLSEETFRAVVYSGRLPGNNEWKLSPALENVRVLWSIYQRNDLLSIAILAVFSAALHGLDATIQFHRRFDTVEQFAHELAREQSVRDCLSSLMPESGDSPRCEARFSSFIEHIGATHPALGNWQDPNHEISLAKNLISHPASLHKYEAPIAEALKMLALLAVRAPEFPVGYGSLLVTASDLQNYPINLISFTRHIDEWSNLSLVEVVEKLTSWILNTHLSVALRKLRQTRQSSFHIEPSEFGLKTAGEVPSPVATLPRIRQALQVLADVGALKYINLQSANSERYLVITDLGESILESKHA